MPTPERAAKLGHSEMRYQSSPKLACRCGRLMGSGECGRRQSQTGRGAWIASSIAPRTGICTVLELWMLLDKLTLPPTRHGHQNSRSHPRTQAPQTPTGNHSPAFKDKVVLESVKGEEPLITIAERFDVHPYRSPACIRGDSPPRPRPAGRRHSVGFRP